MDKNVARTNVAWTNVTVTVVLVVPRNLCGKKFGEIKGPLTEF